MTVYYLLLPYELWTEIVPTERTSFENFTIFSDKPGGGWRLIEIKGQRLGFVVEIGCWAGQPYGRSNPKAILHAQAWDSGCWTETYEHWQEQTDVRYLCCVNSPTASAGSFAPGSSELAGHEATWMPGDLAILAQGQGLWAKTRYGASESAVLAPSIEHLWNYRLAVWQILRAVLCTGAYRFMNQSSLPGFTVFREMLDLRYLSLLSCTIDFAITS